MTNDAKYNKQNNFLLKKDEKYNVNDMRKVYNNIKPNY